MSSDLRELTSWKEIAHHLGVNVRTAQKWEHDRGLPVRRVTGPRGRVSAGAAALDAWKQQLAFETKEDRSYRWPLGPGLAVEVRFLGAEPGPAHIDLLRAYLSVVKKALCGRR